MKDRLPQLDGIRAVLCVTVVVSHWFGSNMGWRDYYFVNAYLSVDGFFILSGLVLSWVYAERIAIGNVSFRSFILHRLARLYPLHFLTFIASVFIYNLFYVEIPFPNPGLNGVVHLLMLQGMGLSQSWSWNDPSWSISVELFASAVGFFYILKARNNGLLFLIACIGYGIVIGKHGNLMAAPDLNLGILSSGFIRCMAGLSTGVIIKNILLESPVKTGSHGGYVLASQILTVLGLCFFLSTNKNIKSYDIIALSGIAYLICTSCIYNNIVSRVLSSPAFVTVGSASFSIYMVHEPIMVMLDKINYYSSMGVYKRTAVFFTLLSFVGYFTHVFIERPSYSMMKSFIDRGFFSGSGCGRRVQ